MKKIIFWGSILLVALLSCNKTYQSGDLIFKHELAYLHGDTLAFSGQVIDRHENGKIKAECNYINGGIHGKYISYHENGAVHQYGIYDSGVAIMDSFKTYFDDGSIKLSEKEAIDLISKIQNEQVINSLRITTYYSGMGNSAKEYLNSDPVQSFIRLGIFVTDGIFEDGRVIDKGYHTNIFRGKELNKVKLRFTDAAKKCIISQTNNYAKEGAYYTTKKTNDYKVLYGEFVFHEITDIYQEAGSKNAIVKYNVKYIPTIFNEFEFENFLMNRVIKYDDGKIKEKKLHVALNHKNEWTKK